MRTQLSLEDSIRSFETFLADRAFQEGSTAFADGVKRTEIPSKMGVFSGYWVEGWLAAAQKAATGTQTAPRPFEDTYRGFQISRVSTAVPALAGTALN
jgi:hypothetical protein